LITLLATCRKGTVEVVGFTEILGPYWLWFIWR
jgi:hypothetical protein